MRPRSGWRAPAGKSAGTENSARAHVVWRRAGRRRSHDGLGRGGEFLQVSINTAFKIDDLCTQVVKRLCNRSKFLQVFVCLRFFKCEQSFVDGRLIVQNRFQITRRS